MVFNMKCNSANLYPVLPLRNVVVYPDMVLPLFISSAKSIEALDCAMKNQKKIVLVAQKQDFNEERYSASDIYNVGTIASVLQLIHLSDGGVKVLVEGEDRAYIKRATVHGIDAIFAEIEKMPSILDEGRDKQLEELVSLSLSLFDQYSKLDRRIPSEILNILSAIEDNSKLADNIAAHLPLTIPEKQKILETFNILERLQKIISNLKLSIEKLQTQQRINDRVKKQFDKTQKEYWLNEQIKAIKKELGNAASDEDDFVKLKKAIKKANMPPEAQEKALSELKKLQMMSTLSSEATVVRAYLETLISLPWQTQTEINQDLNVAAKILDAEHYSLTKVKERILDHLAVQTRVKKLKGPILCLVGPPGIGKTSLGQSIAKATNRNFIRMSLGGVRDEAEIRGHRRTYIGSLPGKIIQNLRKTKVNNPLFLLDEIDKLAMDFHGDPASALLEVLDPEQNNTFNDHYLEIDYDLSNIMFITTANTLNMPPALLDRMEIIRLDGYTENEKIHIAEKHLLPKQLELNGLKKSELEISTEVICDIIRYYTKEAGVRGLERELAKIARKTVRHLTSEENKQSIAITQENLADYLGVRLYKFGIIEDNDQVGQVIGLAWTEIGGELLTVEAVSMPGKGKQIVTGQLGDVMQESIKAASTVIKSRAEQLGIDLNLFKDRDIHIHVPEGAIPKDGPSAGITMCIALVSVLTNIPVRHNVAMTGEITLRGEVLPIGGLKEKLLAAKRGGVNVVIIPEENKKDLKEIENEILDGLEIHPIKWIDQALGLALQQIPLPLNSRDKHNHGKNVLISAIKNKPLLSNERSCNIEN